MSDYVPPFKITAKSITLIADISAQLERYAIRMEQSDALMLRKENRIKTIQGSLAIEGNTLSEDQITAILKALVLHMGATPEVAPGVTPEVARPLNVFRKSEELTRKELQDRLGLKNEKNFRQKHLLPALAVGQIEMTVPDKLNSRLQKYRRPIQ